MNFNLTGFLPTKTSIQNKKKSRLKKSYALKSKTKVVTLIFTVTLTLFFRRFVKHYRLIRIYVTKTLLYCQTRGISLNAITYPYIKNHLSFHFQEMHFRLSKSLRWEESGELKKKKKKKKKKNRVVISTYKASITSDNGFWWWVFIQFNTRFFFLS